MQNETAKPKTRRARSSVSYAVVVEQNIQKQPETCKLERSESKQNDYNGAAVEEPSLSVASQASPEQEVKHSASTESIQDTGALDEDCVCQINNIMRVPNTWVKLYKNGNIDVFLGGRKTSVMTADGLPPFHSLLNANPDIRDSMKLVHDALQLLYRSLEEEPQQQMPTVKKPKQPEAVVYKQPMKNNWNPRPNSRAYSSHNQSYSGKQQQRPQRQRFDSLSEFPRLGQNDNSGEQQQQMQRKSSFSAGSSQNYRQQNSVPQQNMKYAPYAQPPYQNFGPVYHVNPMMMPLAPPTYFNAAPTVVPPEGLVVQTSKGPLFYPPQQQTFVQQPMAAPNGYYAQQQ